MRTGPLFALLLLLATAGVVLWPSTDRLTGEKTILFTVWGAPFEDRLFEDRYAHEWQKLHPDTTVDYRRFGDEITSKYNAWHTRGRGAEVMRIRITDYHGLAARGMLLPLDNFLAPPPTQGELDAAVAAIDSKRPPAPGYEPPPQLRTRPGLRNPTPGDTTSSDTAFLIEQHRLRLEAALADIPPHLRDLLTIHGLQGDHIYAIPEDNAQFGLFYNRALFREYNQAHPREPIPYPPADGSWTWSEFRAAAKKLTKYETAKAGSTPRITQAGIDFAIWAWPYMTFFAQADGHLWSDDGLTCTINSPAGAEALDFLRTLQRVDRSFEPSLSGYQSGTGPDALFAAGRTAMLLDGSWRVPSLELVAPDLDFGVAPLPRGKVPAVVSGCVLWAISANARYKDDAWKYLHWLTEPEQAIVYWETLRVAPPASLAALASPRFRETPGLPSPDGDGWIIPPMSSENYELRAAWMRFANEPDPQTGKPPGFVPIHPYQTELENEITRMLNEWLNPSNSDKAQTLLDRVADHMHRLIDRDLAARGQTPPSRRP